MDMLKDFSLLKKYKFKLLPYAVAHSKKEAVFLAEKIGYPIVLKVLSKSITHKTDSGGVKVGIRNSASLKLAYSEIIENTKSYKIEGILVQKMARKGIELIVGGKKDKQFGSMVILGLGGIYVEIFKDITARICPINNDDICEMVYELKSHPLLTGARGKKAINMNSLKSLLLKFCKFIEQEHILEIDLNPVICDSKGCSIVDVRIKR